MSSISSSESEEENKVDFKDAFDKGKKSKKDINPESP